MRIRSYILLVGCVSLLTVASLAQADSITSQQDSISPQQGNATPQAENKVLGELQLEGTSDVERTSGVWIDGQYLGYLKELKGSKKILLLPARTSSQCGRMDIRSSRAR